MRHDDPVALEQDADLYDGEVPSTQALIRSSSLSNTRHASP